MKILDVDTSTTSCSVALLQDRRLLAEETYTAGKTHSRHLMAMIDGILRRCGWEPRDLGGIAVANGPGTFTGLRIGISTVKGLATAIDKPVVGVGSLAALAYPLNWTRRPVAAMIDARRGEVYFACYPPGSGESIKAPMVADPQAAAAALPDEAILVGSGAVLYRDRLEQRKSGFGFAHETLHVIRAASVGLLAMDRFDSGTAQPAGVLLPKYIRKSDAQIQMFASG
jgi:tRNA threonylcarbamoyladenosine biosynthesis protein TsaB